MIALAALPACGGTETGNPPFAPDLGAGGFDPPGISPDPIVEDARFAVSEAVVEDCDGERHVLFRRASIDFVRSTLMASERFEVPAGAYCAMELRIATCIDPDLCRTVEPDAIAIDGTRRADGLPVHIRETVPLDVRLEGSFELTPESGAVLIALDRNVLTAGLEVGTLEPEGGRVVIDGEMNLEQLETLRSAVPAAMTLRRDLDGDATLDPEELMGAALAVGVSSPGEG